MAPWGLHVELESGLVEEAPGRGGLPPRFPPWSLVLPRYSTFLGREHDDWQMDASRPLVEEPGSLIAALTNLEDPRFTGTLTVNVYTNTITSVDLGTWCRRSPSSGANPTMMTWQPWRTSKPASGGAGEAEHQHAGTERGRSSGSDAGARQLCRGTVGRHA